MGEGASAIERALEPHPHAGLTVEPTPIHRLANLSERLGREVFALREDLTGFGLGGNKVRKLDYLVADALARGADTLVTTGASAFSRNAAAAATARGLALHVLIAGGPAEHNLHSRALFERHGATLRYVPEGAGEALARAEERLVSGLRERGRVVYPMPPGGSTEIGTLGFVRVFGQIARHAERTGAGFDTIILPSGSAGTQAGLVVGRALAGSSARVVGIAISRSADEQRGLVRRLGDSTARMLGATLDPSSVLVDDRFLGAGYPIPSEAGDAAVALLARLEGLELDRVYTGKAAAGLIHLAETGAIAEGGRTLFVHTGGNGGLYY